jgi:phosphohistidine phosphatase
MTGWSKICEPRPTRVYASPYVRAQQTAVIASVILGLDPQEIAAHNGLVPHASAADALAPLGRDRSESILLVGHAPNLDLVLAALLGARQPLSRLKKSGLATVEIPRGSVSAGSGVLFALYSPGLLRRLEGLPP